MARRGDQLPSEEGLLVVETHPIQYHAPVYRDLVQSFGVPVTAVYGSDFSVAGYTDREFGAALAWDTDLLSGYRSHFLERVATGGATSFEDVRGRGLASIIRRCRPAVVLLPGYSTPLYRSAALWTLLQRVPVFFRGETTDHALRRGWLKAHARDTLLRAFYACCRRLLFVGQRSREHFRRLGVAEDRLVFSPYCVDTAPFQTDEIARSHLRATCRSELGITDDQRVILFSGKLSERKGVDLLLAAHKMLPETERPRTCLLFMGDGDLRRDLEQTAAVDPTVAVRCVGFQNQTHMSRFYHAADLLALPSRSGETWGLVVNEALHHGVPCVVSDAVGCAPDLVEPGRTGAIFASESAGDLVAAFARVQPLLGSREARDQCREKVAHYTVHEAARGLARAYHDTVRSAPQQTGGI